MFDGALQFSSDISDWSGTAAKSRQNDIFLGAIAYQKKYWCPSVMNGPVSLCVCKFECPRPPSPFPPPSPPPTPPAPLPPPTPPSVTPLSLSPPSWSAISSLFLPALLEDTNIKIYASDSADNDWFGSAVSLYGDVALIAARQDDDNATNTGSVYVFRRYSSYSRFEGSTTTIWTEQTKLHPSDPSEFDGFGRSVSFFDDTALIGAGADDDEGSNAGSVYVFTMHTNSSDESSSSSTWVQQTKFYASYLTDADYFGASVSLYGDTAFIGATGDDEKATNAGAVYVFTRKTSLIGTVWTEKTKIYASDPAPEDGFGQSLSLHGDRALIGANTDSNTTEINTGSVYEFVRSFDNLNDEGIVEEGAFTYSDGSYTAKWVEQTTKILAPDLSRSDLFGVSVALYGNTALIGASGDDENATNTGSVYIFTRKSSSSSSSSEVSLWIGETKIYASDPAAGDVFGNSISLYGDTALIGAFQNDDQGTNTGRVYVFKAPPPPAPPPPSPPPPSPPSPPPDGMYCPFQRCGDSANCPCDAGECSDPVHGIEFKRVSPRCMRTILEYCASHDPEVSGQVDDPGCRRFLNSKSKVQSILRDVKTRIDSDLPSIGGRSMAIEFPAGALSEDTDVSIAELEDSDLSGSLPSSFAGTTTVGSIINLTPHGTVFNSCVTIEVPYTYTNSYLAGTLLKAADTDSDFELVSDATYVDNDDGTYVLEWRSSCHRMVIFV